MLKALIRVRFASLFSSMFLHEKTETTMSTGKKVLFGILWLYVSLCCSLCLARCSLPLRPCSLPK